MLVVVIKVLVKVGRFTFETLVFVIEEEGSGESEIIRDYMKDRGM